MLRSDARTAELMELVFGPYAERRQRRFNSFDQALLSAGEALRVRFGGTRARYGTMVGRIDNMAPQMHGLSDGALRARAMALRPQLLRAGLAAGPLCAAFAIVREVTARK